MSKKIFILSNALFKRSLALVLIVLPVACNKFIEPSSAEFGYQYYPMEMGQFRTYYTQVIDYALDGSIDTTRYLTKELVEDTIRYTDGTLKYILGRYSMDLEGMGWHKDSLWAVSSNQSKVVMSEANVDYIKLSFPVMENMEWDGNALNGRDKEIYELNNLKQPYSYDTLNYENTLTVVQADLVDPNKITEDDYRFEVFALDVGLVHKFRKKVIYCDPSKCSENGIIENGVIFEQKLIEFGKE